MSYHYNGPARSLDHGQRTIRPATLSDSRFIHRLSMDPSVRAMSTRGEEFLFEAHNVWYQEKLAHPEAHRIWVIEVAEVEVGMVRYGKDGDEAEIAIAISPPHQGLGYASDLLTTTMPWAARDLAVSRMVALVLTTNIRSRFLFTSNGFHHVCDEVRLEKTHWRYERAI